MTKLSAFLSHLGISLLIFIVVLYFIVFQWYPMPLFETDGGWQGIRIIAIVDIVLGPLLTLVVFKSGKKGLRFDLTIIGLIQLSALTSGIWIVQNERPVVVVFVEDHFQTIPAYHVKEAGISTSELSRFGSDLPVMVFSNLPENSDQFFEVQREALARQLPLYMLGEYYQPLSEDNRKRILKKALDMETFLLDRPKDLETYQSYLQRNDEKKKTLLFFALRSRYNEQIVSVNKESLELIDTLDITLL